MTTSRQMLEFAAKYWNGITSQSMPYQDSFDVIVNALQSNETVHFAFIGVGYRKLSDRMEASTSYLSQPAIVITDTRMIIAGYAGGLFSKNSRKYTTHTYLLSSIESVRTVDTWEEWSIRIETASGILVINEVKKKQHDIARDLSKVIDDLKHKTISQGAPVSNADEILKYKKLSDAGIISQEEFEAKKKQLLGL